MKNDIETALELYRQRLDRLIAQHIDDVKRLHRWGEPDRRQRKALARQFDADSRQLAKDCGLL